MSEKKESAAVVIPPNYKRFVSLSGKWSQFTRTLLFGGEKAGKSRLAAGAPGRKIAIDTGEFGIQPYLTEEDVCLTVTDAAEQAEVFEWACSEAQEGRCDTIIMDSGTVFWASVKDAGYEKVGSQQVQFQDWAWIKRPVKKVVSAAMQVPANVLVTCWLRDIAVDQGDAAPGKKAKLRPKAVEMPDIERKFGYFFDSIYGLEKGLDSKNRPNGKFKITFWGGRIPPSVPNGLLYTGRSWEYDTAKEIKTPGEVYDDVIGWMGPYREKGGVPRMIGQDPAAVKAAWRELEEATKDEAVGAVVRALGEIQSPEQWKLEAQKKILPLTLGLDPSRKEQVQRLVNQRKTELGLKE